jgi:hypothetical protein
MAAAGGNTFVFVGGQLFNGNPVKGQPYSAEAVTETTQTLTDGNRIVNRSSTMMYRDTEGRERREESMSKLGGWTSGGEPAKAVFISDPVAKMSYTLHTADRTAERIPASANGVGAMLRTNTVTTSDGTTAVTTSAGSNEIALAYKIGAEAGVTHAAETLHAAAGGRGAMIAASPGVHMDQKTGGAPTKVENLGTQLIEGVPAEGTRTTQTIPAGQMGNERDINIVSERWYSQELQMVVMTKRSDPRTGDTVYKLTNVNRSEPQHYLFEVPSDYTVFDSAAVRARKVAREDQ